MTESGQRRPMCENTAAATLLMKKWPPEVMMS